MRTNFAVFILSHGRANNVLTIKALERAGYTGKIYIICDDEDKQLEEYRKLYKEKVFIFSKKEMDGTFDIGDNLNDRRVVIYARNKCHEIAKLLYLDYFLVLDDDYTNFRFRVEKDGVLKSIYCRHIDKVFEAMLDFLDCANITTVALAQTGDFIGGTDSNVFKQKLPRKAMNSFFCRTDRPFKFYGRINEDVNMYVTLGSRGELVFTTAECSLDQLATQSNPGGLTNIYVDQGTYYKSFITVMYNPSCCKVGLMGQSNKRLHHKIYWNYCTPKILSEKYRKASYETI